MDYKDNPTNSYVSNIKVILDEVLQSFFALKDTTISNEDTIYPYLATNDLKVYSFYNEVYPSIGKYIKPDTKFSEIKNSVTMQEAIFSDLNSAKLYIKNGGKLSDEFIQKHSQYTGTTSVYGNKYIVSITREGVYGECILYYKDHIFPTVSNYSYSDLYTGQTVFVNAWSYEDMVSIYDSYNNTVRQLIAPIYPNTFTGYMNPGNTVSKKASNGYKGDNKKLYTKFKYISIPTSIG